MAGNENHLKFQIHFIAHKVSLILFNAKLIGN